MDERKVIEKPADPDAVKSLKGLAHRRTGMDAEFAAWKPHFEALRENIQPTRGRFSLGDKSGQTLNKKIIDATARRALRTLKSGLMSGMTSPSRKWFKLGLHDEAAEQDAEVAAYLHHAEKMAYAVLRASNVYRTLDAAYADLGLFGTFGGMIVSDFEDVITTHAFPMGGYRIQEDHRGKTNVMHRDMLQTVSQIVNRFGIEQCSTHVQNKWIKNDHYAFVEICHAVEERSGYDPTSPLGAEKQFASLYWEKGQTDRFLEISGMDHNSILGPRWERLEGEAWGVNSPGMDALGDAVQLQGQHRDKALAIQLQIRPPLQGPAGSSQNFRNIPGGITTLNVSDLQKGGLRPAYEARTDIQSLMMDIEETRKRISSSFYEDLFLMTTMSDRRQVTATEIAERHEEKLLVLGPVLESLDNGLLSPIVEATFLMMQKADLLPPAPESIAGRPIRVEYISLLAQAQRAVGVAAIERTVGFAGSLAQLKPEVLDVLDGDEILREFSDQIGPPPKILRDKSVVDQQRQANAQAAQQAEQTQMMMENAQPMAQAAKLISETANRGDAGMQKQGVGI